MRLPSYYLQKDTGVLGGGRFRHSLGNPTCKGPEREDTARGPGEGGSLYLKRVGGGQGEEMGLGSAGTSLRNKVTSCNVRETFASESLQGSW